MAGQPTTPQRNPPQKIRPYQQLVSLKKRRLYNNKALFLRGRYVKGQVDQPANRWGEGFVYLRIHEKKSEFLMVNWKVTKHQPHLVGGFNPFEKY